MRSCCNDFVCRLFTLYSAFAYNGVGGDFVNCRNCCIRTNCAGLAIIAGIIVGIITAFLQITAVITLTPVFLWVLFGIAVGYLAVILISLSVAEGYGIRECICSVLPVLLTGILGTVITALVLLGVTFAATSVVGAVFAGLLLLFFTITLAATACLVNCLAGCSVND